MQSWPEGRNWVGQCTQATGMTASLRILSSKADSDTWESFTRSGLKLESSGKGLPSHFWNRNNVRSILPGLRRKRTGLLLSGSKSSFQIKVHFTFHLEIKVWSLEKDSDTESKLLEVQCEVSEVSDDLGCRNVCWFWSIVFYQVQSQRSPTRRFWSTLCFHLLTSFMEMLISFSSRTLAPAHSTKTTSKCFADHDIIVLDLNPIWNLWDIFKRKMRNSRSNNPDELKAQWCLSSATDWSLPWHTSLMLEFVQKELRPSIECINEHTLKNLDFSVLQTLFLTDLRKYSNILRYWIFDFHEL